NVGLVEQQLPGGALSRIEIIHPVEYPQQGRLAATGRADERGNAMGTQRDVDVLQRMVFAIVKIQPARGDLGRRFRLVGPRWRRSIWNTHGYGKVVHFAVLSAPRTRAPIFRASTVSVMIKAPLQASCFQ